jgi:hypothetical protein
MEIVTGAAVDLKKIPPTGDGQGIGGKGIPGQGWPAGGEDEKGIKGYRKRKKYFLHQSSIENLRYLKKEFPGLHPKFTGLA